MKNVIRILFLLVLVAVAYIQASTSVTDSTEPSTVALTEPPTDVSPDDSSEAIGDHSTIRPTGIHK